MKNAFFLLFLLILISCGYNRNLNKDGEISISLGGEPRTLDPTLNSLSFGSIYMIHFFEGLTKRDVNDRMVPGMAESWEISEDGLKYTFYLRKDSKWSDGKPVTANDFVYSFRRAANPISAVEYTSFVEYVKNAAKILAGEMSVNRLGVRAIDDHTLEVDLESPTGYFLDILTYPVFAPIRSDVIEEYGDEWTLKPETYIGNGAFVMIERSPDSKIVMIKNTNYWNRENIVPEKITFVIMRDPTLALAGIKEGSLDFSVQVLDRDIENLKSEGILNIAPYYSTFAFGINATNGILKDTRIRKALSLAIDRNYIVEKVVLTAKSPTSAWIPFGANDVEGDFRENGGEYIDLSKDAYSNNVAEAKRLMAEAGYPNGENFPVLDYKTTSDSVYINVAEAVQ